MPRNHVSLLVAEQFGMLEALHPGRIDARHRARAGHGPGHGDGAAAPLAGEGCPPTTRTADGPARLLHRPDGRRVTRSRRSPRCRAGATSRTCGCSGSSNYSAQVVSLLGLPFAFAHHFSAVNTLPALALYRQPLPPVGGPRAPVRHGRRRGDVRRDRRARPLAGSSRRRAVVSSWSPLGHPGPLPSPEEAGRLPLHRPRTRVRRGPPGLRHHRLAGDRPAQGSASCLRRPPPTRADDHHHDGFEHTDRLSLASRGGSLPLARASEAPPTKPPPSPALRTSIQSRPAPSRTIRPAPPARPGPPPVPCRTSAPVPSRDLRPPSAPPAPRASQTPGAPRRRVLSAAPVGSMEH